LAYEKLSDIKRKLAGKEDMNDIIRKIENLIATGK